MSQEKPFYSHFLSLPEEATAWDSALCCLIQAPLENTTSFQHGTATAPQAVLRASEQIELYDPSTDRDLSDLSITTPPAAKLAGLSTKEALGVVEELVDKALDSHKWPLVIGGEQIVSYAAVRALVRRHPELCVVQLDAHLDLKDSFGGTPYSHRCASRRVFELGVSMIHLGSRSYSREEAEFVEKNPQRLTRISCEDLKKKASLLEGTLKSVSAPIYLSIDMSVLDPSECPGVSNPEPAGLSWTELLKIVDTLFSHRMLVGADIVEVSPIPGDSRAELLAAKLATRLFDLHQTGTTP
ncbi:MAG: agmatinase [Bdellovibrionota bacterium]